MPVRRLVRPLLNGLLITLKSPVTVENTAFLPLRRQPCAVALKRS